MARLYAWSVPLEREALRVALDLADISPGNRVLDVATGTGALLRELDKRDLRAIRAIGIDRSRAMLAEAERVLRDAALVEADARALPFPDGCFDVITVSYLLHLLGPEDRAVALSEVRRVLHPGGRAVFVTIDSSERTVRSLLKNLPRWTTLRRIDLSSELDARGLRLVATRYTRPFWPSTCLLAQRTN